MLKEGHSPFACTSCDRVIIGGGPAGLTAAVYAATLKVSAYLMTTDLGGQALDSTMIENYMGYDFITGPELTAKFRDQLLPSHYIDHQICKAEAIEPAEGGFHITTSEQKRYFAKALIVATGMTSRRLNVSGEEAFQRKGVFYGNLQDLSFVQGEDVAVIGGGNSALQIVENLHRVAAEIRLISNSELKADPVIIERVKRFKNLRIYEGYEVLQFGGEKRLASVLIRKRGEKEAESCPVKGVFTAIGLQPNGSLVSSLLDLNEKGEITIGPDCSTSYPGIFAAGDVTSAFGKRIIIASGEGAKAAMAARQYLLKLREERN